MKKRILIISGPIKKGASGLVFHNILKNLSKIHELEVVTPELEFKDLDQIGKIYIVPHRKFNRKLERFLLKNFAFNLSTWAWCFLVMRKLKKKSDLFKFDFVLNLISLSCFHNIYAANKISKKLGLKHFLYSVDPLPLPSEWWVIKPEGRIKEKGIKKTISNFWTITPSLKFEIESDFVQKELKNVDVFFASNEKMLDYQLKLISQKDDFYAGVLYTPIYTNNLSLKDINLETNYFLYAGSFYGPRKPSYLLKAFEMLLETFPNSVLEILGRKIDKIWLKGYQNQVVSKIHFYDFQENLIPFYHKATALIDIDGEVENEDVFLSSKIVNYLPINRPIISQTGPNSPSRELFKNMSSIIQCNHDFNEIYNAMLYTIKNKNKISMDDRKDLIQKFSIETQIKTLNQAIFRYVN